MLLIKGKEKKKFYTMLTIVVDGQRARVGRAVESKKGVVYEAFLRCIMYLRTQKIYLDILGEGSPSMSR